MTTAQALEVWKMTRDAYQAMRGVKRPHIAEISPMQMGLMSKRQRSTYSTTRGAEWDASAKCYADYRAECYAAYVLDQSILIHSEITKDAKNEIGYGIQIAKEQRDAQVRALLNATNRVKVDDVVVGDVVFSIMRREYLKVTKKWAVSIEGTNDVGACFKTKIMACMWLSHDDLNRAVEQGRTDATRLAGSL